MKTVTTGMNAALAAPVAMMCVAVRLERTDGVVLALTDHDAPIEINGETFRPAPGLARVSEALTGNASIDQQVWTGALRDEGLLEADLAAGFWDGAVIDVWHVDWSAPSQRLHLFAGLLGAVQWGEGQFRADVQSWRGRLERPVGRIYGRTCDAVFGDARCGVAATASPFVVTTPILAILNANTFEIERLSAIADQWFCSGLAQFGAARGVEITAHSRGAVRDQIILSDPLSDVTVGAAVTLRTGCDKRFQTCRQKFNNSANFRGFPHMPGPDAVIAGADVSAPLDGGSRWKR